jgi:hypothetical protein
MARKNIQSGTEEFELFKDFWNIYKENATVESTDEYINKIISDADNFYKKYNSPFAQELAVAFVNEMDRKMMEEKKHG